MLYVQNVFDEELKYAVKPCYSIQNTFEMSRNRTQCHCIRVNCFNDLIPDRYSCRLSNYQGMFQLHKPKFQSIPLYTDVLH